MLARGDLVRAAFVPTQAGPLAGDRERVLIVVGEGATLAIEPIAATLALPGAARIHLRLDVVVGAGGRLVLDEGPLIVAAGADVVRRCSIELASGAVAALRETFVLGRHGEPPGMLDSALRATLAGAALLHDGCRVRGEDPHVALAPGHRVATTVGLLGTAPQARAEIFELEGPGGLARVTGTSLAAVDATVDPLWRAWSRAALDADRSAVAHARTGSSPAGEAALRASTVEHAGEQFFASRPYRGADRAL